MSEGQSREDLIARMRARAHQIHVLFAGLAEDVGLFDREMGWRGTGRSGCADWVGVELGFDPHNADALTALCTARLCGGTSGDDDDIPERPVQLIVHADLDTLSVKVLLEKTGVAVAATRERHRVPPAMRWKVQERDRICDRGGGSAVRG